MKYTTNSRNYISHNSTLQLHRQQTLFIYIFFNLDESHWKREGKNIIICLFHKIIMATLQLLFLTFFQIELQLHLKRQSKTAARSALGLLQLTRYYIYIASVHCLKQVFIRSNDGQFWLTSSTLGELHNRRLAIAVKLTQDCSTEKITMLTRQQVQIAAQF